MRGGLAAALAAALVLAGALAAPRAASALTVTLDPGPVGSGFVSGALPFPDLTGTTFAGQTLTLDVVFADAKTLTPDYGPPSGGFFVYNVILALLHDGGLIGLGAITEAYLADRGGTPLASPFVLGAAQDPGLQRFIASYPGPGGPGITHYGLRLTALLPTAPGVTVTGAELRLAITAPEGTIEIRQGDVPLPATLPLALGALAALGAATRRPRPRRAPAGAGRQP